MEPPAKPWRKAYFILGIAAALLLAGAADLAAAFGLAVVTAVTGTAAILALGVSSGVLLRRRARRREITRGNGNGPRP